MRTRTQRKVLLAAGGAVLVGLLPALARAQNDVSPHLPNVLLLLDTSGSMDYLIAPGPDGVTPITPEDQGAPADAACALNGTTKTMTRWASLVSVLTGSFQPGAFGCETLKRNESKFVTEFTLPGTTTPYDYNYYIPWHRIYSNGCTIGAPQILGTQDWSNWGSSPFDYHNTTGQCLNGTNSGNCCAWTGQNNDGLLDAFAGMVRFGMMTFDSFPDPSTGATVGSPSYVDGPGAVRGMWSYFHNWQTAAPPNPPVLMGQGTKPAAGEPAGCSSPRYMEVGARNPAAPPWEGPLTAFGDPYSDTQIGIINQQIQNQIIAMRPYGATPIAGMLDDAAEFLYKDTSNAPGVTPARPFGPYNDPFWQGGCRKTFIILLTDGFPNEDMRGASGQCDASPNNPTATCPYDTPENTLTMMRQNPPGGNLNQAVTTFVVGFALSQPAALPAGKTSCSQLTAADCANPTPALQACCKLQSLALAGGGPGATAFFADNPGQLKQVLTSILSQIIGSTTSRTSPVYANAGQANTQGPQLSGNPALSYHFAASFNVTSSSTQTNFASGNGTTGLWSGNLVRERYVCQNGTPNPASVDPNLGDDYAANLNSNDAAHPRQFLTAIGTNVASGSNIVINSDWTIRPFVTTDDGFGVYQPQTPTSGLTPASSFPTLMSNYPAAFGIAQGSDPNCKNAFGLTNSPNTCAQYLMNWEIGGTNTLPIALSPAPSRDPSSAYCTENPARKCSKLGAIVHSTPVVMGPPREFLRDDTYTSYANDPNIAGKPMMLYTATTDGQLHAFKVSASSPNDTFTTDKMANNELWSFLPPAVLQHIMPNYNTGGSTILDGAPVIADVPGVTPLGTLPPVFERTPTSAPVWHRVLVAGGGSAGGFYYALDVTDPTNPIFLWQLSTDGYGNPLFGSATPTPAIGSVAIMENNVRTQVPVAFLSGGTGLQLTPCTPPTPPVKPASFMPNDQFNPSNPNGSIYHLGPQQTPLQCWQRTLGINGAGCAGNCGQGQGGRKGAVQGASFAIVRLDTGAVLAYFTGIDALNSPPSQGGNNKNLYTGQVITSPVTGIPAVYPADTGQVADRVYVGDADGQLWRIDLSNPDRTQWTFTFAWDAYADTATATREQVALAPVLSRDPVGNMTIIFATGNQDLLTSQSTDNRVWSLTETPLNHNTSQNWYLKFAPGQERVTGPMALFNNVLYFSTYTPTSTAGGVCADGSPELWAVDYTRPDPAYQLYTGSPLPTTPNVFNVPNALMQKGAQGSVIFGVSATETPSCGGSVNTSDAYFGSHSAVSGVNQSEYRVMWQTGAGNGLTTNANIRNETSVKGMQNMTVPAPGLGTRIDSWAAIVE